VAFNLGERIKQVRAIEQKINAAEAEFADKMKPFNEFVEKARAEILQFLLTTKQKSANTEFGGTYWKPKITYRVVDKMSFRRHVVGTEQWDLITWASAPTICEAFTQNNEGIPPPGTERNEVITVYITAPTKPRVKKTPEAPVDNEPPVESLV
jgi:hypothetical protein